MIEFGDCRDIMRRWHSERVQVQTCVTSPPYFGLRDYGHDGQIGLEETPEQYIEAMVEVFRCVRDVLADDGTLWLNLGDSYANQKFGGDTYSGFNDRYFGRKTDGGKQSQTVSGAKAGKINFGHLKPKDLIGIPWRVAFALQSDGWYLRQDIIWHKPNPMPESVTDRCTKSHEYIFLLSKSERYYYDSRAIAEKSIYAGDDRGSRGDSRRGTTCNSVSGKTGESRNRRSVWTITTKPYKGAHFATFPTTLIEPCVLAGSRRGDIVLDPFIGSGTTAQVALTHGRKYLGCELNRSYEPLQQERIDLATKQGQFIWEAA